MKKKILGLLLAVSMVAGLTACGNSAEEKQENTNSSAASEVTETETTKTDEAIAGDEVSIQFMHMQIEQERQEILKALIAKFETENPGIKVEQIPVNEDDYDAKITALGGSGELPAIIEFSQDQAKTNVKNQFTDIDAINEVITAKGEDAFFEGALAVTKTEDGAGYVGVPLQSWVQGIWVNEGMLAEKGFKKPTNWEEVLEIAKAFNDPANKKYGISIPTGENTFTEQVFSQFAISNGANVFDADGKIVMNTPEMKEALEYYKELASYSMPGSTEVADVKDAFVGQNAPMAMYSTYIIPAVAEAGFIDKLSLALPTNKSAAAYGCITVLSLSNTIEPAETEAAKKFVNFLLEDENNVSWLHMAPGGVQPVLTAVNGSEAYLDNEVIQSFAHLSDDIGVAVENLQLFGTVGGKNFMAMGDITNTGIISKMLNNVIVQKADSQGELDKAQKEIEKLVQ